MGSNIKISTEIASAATIVGEEKAIELLAQAGFDAWDFSMFAMLKYDWGKKVHSNTSHPQSGNDYLSIARQLKRIGLDNGMVCNQSHAPFPTNTVEIYPYLKRAIECTAEAGGEICVIHPDNNKSAEENAEMYLELLPFAKECGVKIATENMWNWDKEKDHAVFAACATPKSFCEHIDVVGSDYLVACLDIGHAEMIGLDSTAVEMIEAFDYRLQALHIHDNDKVHDSHQIPFSMDIDFKSIAAALKEINYSGYFTLEADRFLADYTEENVFAGIKKLADSAKKLVELYELY